MGEGAEDIMLPQAPVEGDGFGKGGDLGSGAAGEAAGAGDNSDFFHARSGAESAACARESHARRGDRIKRTTNVGISLPAPDCIHQHKS